MYKSSHLFSYLELVRISKKFFANLAKSERYKSRAAYKLREIDDKFGIFKRKQHILDLGCAPGSWIQIANERVGKEGFIIGVDIQPVSLGFSNFIFIKGDFTKERIRSAIDRYGLFDVVVSDAAPEFSGIKERDIGLSLRLNEESFNLCKRVLKDNGSFVLKAFHGPGLNDFVDDLRERFSEVKRFKPKASSKESPEIYLVCKGFKRS